MLNYRSIAISENKAGIEKICDELQKIFEVGDLILLNGDLGAGKTFFTKCIIDAIDSTISVSSPTFNFYNLYHIFRFDIWHYDLYRLKDDLDQNDLVNLDLDEAISSGLVIIEWANKIQNLAFNKNCLQINIEYFQENTEDRSYVFTFFAESKWGKFFNGASWIV
jgi:tRNA threonylcarbamoyladenosine biosynthesis protein TsaE